ncbi:MAG: sugar ABC transporter permease [Clostridia bacterium]|nr:sugar ABC transporter permease [Clostridia bacterium]
MSSKASHPAVRVRKRWSYFFLALPLMALVILFRYVPLAGWYLAFIDYKVGKPILECDFVGLKFFEMLLKSRDMKRVLTNTCIFSCLYMVMLVIPPTFAILLNELKSKGFSKLSQTAATLPHFVSWVLVYSVFYALLNSEGVVNRLLALFNTSQKWMSRKDAVYVFQSFVWAWKNVGWKAIIYIAAIAGIDQALYEAATVDGANRFQCALHITVPGLMPTFLVLFLLAIGDFVSNGLEQYFVFDNTIVSKNIETIELYTYKNGLKRMDYSYATAVGIFQSAISIVLLFLANGASKLIRGESIV